MKAGKVQKKAGLIPYCVHPDGQLKFMFMTPSNPKYGGSKPSIAKGTVEPHEFFMNAAIREAEEELGLIIENVNLGTLRLQWSGLIKNTKRKYELFVYSCCVKSPKNFAKPHYETGSTHWLAIGEFLKIGREDHRDIVLQVERGLNQKGENT